MKTCSFFVGLSKKEFTVGYTIQITALMFFAIQLRLLLIFEGLGLWRGGRLFEFDIYDGFTRTECWRLWSLLREDEVWFYTRSLSLWKHGLLLLFVYFVVVVIMTTESWQLLHFCTLVDIITGLLDMGKVYMTIAKWTRNVWVRQIIYLLSLAPAIAL